MYVRPQNPLPRAHSPHTISPPPPQKKINSFLDRTLAGWNFAEANNRLAVSFSAQDALYSCIARLSLTFTFSISRGHGKEYVLATRD